MLQANGNMGPALGELKDMTLCAVSQMLLT